MLTKLGFHKGVNLGGWFSQCDYSADRLDNFITEPDFARIAQWQLDHVRIPIDYNVIETPEGGIFAEGFDRIELAVGLCAKYGLRVVLDLHKAPGFSFDGGEGNGFFEEESQKERFYVIWEEFARRFGRMHETVVFELLNEVTDEKFIGRWNSVSHECIRRIRAIAPDTVILIGSWNYNSAASLKDLEPPYDDRIVYNFHCYDPHYFTHQGAPWANGIDPQRRVSFGETQYTPASFKAAFACAVEAAKKRGTSLYCGEYGTIENAQPEDCLAWYRAIHSAFEECGIPRCAWTYRRMDFGLLNECLDGVRSELIKYL